MGIFNKITNLPTNEIVTGFYPQQGALASRQDFYQIANQEVREQTEAVACIVFKHLLEKTPQENQYKFAIRQTLGQRFSQVGKRIDSNTPFYNQPSYGLATAFLINENQLLSSGHAPDGKSWNEFSFKKLRVIFGYRFSEPHQSAQKVEAFKIKKIKQVHLSRGLEWADWAIIVLKKSVKRIPLSLSFLEPKANARFSLLSHPLGVPLKIATGAILKGNEGSTLTTDHDVFQAESGAPLIEEWTKKVVGILGEGPENFEEAVDAKGKLQRLRVIPSDQRCAKFQKISALSDQLLNENKNKRKKEDKKR